MPNCEARQHTPHGRSIRGLPATCSTQHSNKPKSSCCGLALQTPSATSRPEKSHEKKKKLRHRQYATVSVLQGIRSGQFLTTTAVYLRRSLHARWRHLSGVLLLRKPFSTALKKNITLRYKLRQCFIRPTPETNKSRASGSGRTSADDSNSGRTLL